MKLPPRERAPAKVYEMEADSGFLLLFKTRENAHMYTKDSIAPYKVNGSARRKRKQPAKSAKPSAAVAAKATKKGKATNASSASQANSSLLFPSSQPTPMTQQPITNFIELARQGSTTHRWEFADDNGGWSLYDLEASKLVEMEYQSWLQQPEVFVRSVHSGFFHYSVNFNKMEQTNIKHPARRVRKIRRVAATEGGQGASGGLFGSAAVPSFLPASPPQVMSSVPTFSMTPTPTNGPLWSAQPSPLTMCGSAMNSINSSTTNAPFSFGPAGTALPPPPIPAGSQSMPSMPTSTEAASLAALQQLMAVAPLQPSARLFGLGAQQLTGVTAQQVAFTPAFFGTNSGLLGSDLGRGIWSYSSNQRPDDDSNFVSSYDYSEQMGQAIESAYRSYMTGRAPNPIVEIKVPNTIFIHEFDFSKMESRNLSARGAPMKISRRQK